MSKTISRSEILSRLHKQTEAGRPILGAGCSSGLVAKCAELAGADLIIAYSTGKTRTMGLPTTMITGTSNPMTLEMAPELRNVVKDTPIIAGMEANDIFVLDLEESIQRFVDAGFSGFINFPTVGLLENLLEGGKDYRVFSEIMAPGYRQDSWGWKREVEMMRVLNKLDLFTMAYVLSPEDAIEMAEAGVDVICAHVGPSMGGLTGYVSGGVNEMLATGQAIMEAAKSVRSDVICTIHGGPFYDPDSSQVIYQETDAVGFVAASAIERIPVEQAVMGVCDGYKNLAMPRWEK